LLGTYQYHRLKAIYSPDESDEPWLSGVGINLVGHYEYFRVPLSYEARWDDEGPQLSDMLKVPSVQIERSPRANPDQQRSQWFLLHAQCSTLLKEFFYPRAIPIARLIDLCRSFPEYNNDTGYDRNPWDEFDTPSRQIRIQDDVLKIPELEDALHNAQLGKSDKKTLDLKQIHKSIPNCFTSFLTKF
jgi:hypothetical protein